MHSARILLSVAGVPLLAGCMMMGGSGHTAYLGPTHEPGHTVRSVVTTSPLHAAASTNGLVIEIFVPTASQGAAVTIDARVFADGDDHEVIEGAVWLRIQTPNGAVEEIRMQRPQSSTGGTYRAEYRFLLAGLYLVTAVGREGSGSDLRTASVTTEVEVTSTPHGDQHGWLMPAAILGGLGMIAMMAVMMGN